MYEANECCPTHVFHTAIMPPLYPHLPSPFYPHKKVCLTLNSNCETSSTRKVLVSLAEAAAI